MSLQIQGDDFFDKAPAMEAWGLSLATGTHCASQC